MNYKAECLCDALCIVGESPVWRSETRTLFMTDVHGRRIRSIDWASGKANDLITARQTGALLLDKNGGLLACQEDGIYRVSDSGAISPLFAPIKLKGLRFNDVKVGPDGRIYGGTIDYGNDGAFYVIEQNGSVRTLLTGIGNSNGLDWDTEHSVLYYIDTPTGCLFSFRFDGENGTIHDRRIVRHFAPEEGNPDGMTMDIEGKLWIALWGSGHVIRLDPETSKTIGVITLPVSNVSCPAFAGDDLDVLVITTAAHNTMLRKEPLAGAVFSVKTGTSGIPQMRFSPTV